MREDVLLAMLAEHIRVWSEASIAYYAMPDEDEDALSAAWDAVRDAVDRVELLHEALGAHRGGRGGAIEDPTLWTEYEARLAAGSDGVAVAGQVGSSKETCHAGRDV